MSARVVRGLRAVPHVAVSCVVMFLALMTAGCASTGATFGSGVGDAFPEHAPWIAGHGRAAGSGATGHLPVAYQAGATDEPFFDPPADGAIAALLADLDAALAALAVSTPLPALDAQTSGAERRIPPDVRFGCQTPSGLSTDDCAVDEDEALGRGPARMHLAVGRPSPEWSAVLAERMEVAGVDHVLVLTLEVGQWLPLQRGLRGTKHVELSMGHVVELPWLTSLETPVEVLQLTGAVVGPDGKAVRIGAAGLAVRRTRLGLSALGAQELFGEEDVETLRRSRREDLPGRPPVWQAALESLVADLLR